MPSHRACFCCLPPGSPVAAADNALHTPQRPTAQLTSSKPGSSSSHANEPPPPPEEVTAFAEDLQSPYGLPACCFGCAGGLFLYMARTSFSATAEDDCIVRRGALGAAVGQRHGR
eukprot:scaffold4194_cov131-Isochrysis_galbana.AAC.5